MSKGLPIVDDLFSLGTRSGMPRYVAFLGLAQTGVLFVPESVWTALGIDALRHLQDLPVFVQYYINAASFKNAMYVFWLLSPFTLSVSTFLWMVHTNFKGYPAYLQRRAARLKQQGQNSGYWLMVGELAFLAMYVWGTGINLKEPGLWGDFVPVKNRLSMVIVHAGAISLFLPSLLTLLITELRASLSELRPKRS